MSETNQQDANTPGITDLATREVLVLDNNKLTVRGDVKVYGVLDAGLIRTTEIITNQRHEKQFLEFANPEGGPENTGFLWTGSGYNKQFVFKNSPDRFFSSESIDIPTNQSYLIDGVPALSSSELGRGVTISNLKKLGTLRELTVGGPVNFGDHVYYNPSSQRVGLGTNSPNGLFTVYDYDNNVELILHSNDKYGIIGTHNNKGLQLITDNQSRITLEVNGDITLGQEQRDGTQTRVYGKLSVGIKNPTEQFEVSGNIRFANKLFATGSQTPNTGNFNIGDVVWNSNPKSGDYIGWVCIQGGTPGQWTPFGLIA
jgi:hypothetical protein